MAHTNIQHRHGDGPGCDSCHIVVALPGLWLFPTYCCSAMYRAQANCVHSALHAFWVPCTDAQFMTDMLVSRNASKML